MVCCCVLENYNRGKEFQRSFKFTKKKEGIIGVEK